MKQALDMAAAFGTNGDQPSGLLDDYRVDLFELLEHGVPEAKYVPGLEGFVRSGKRYLVPASAGTGKSLAGLRIAVGVVQSGGAVAILDVENGSDEYARRLSYMLDACGGLAPVLRSKLSYFAWPRLSLTWNAEQWVAAFGRADLVIFDSSRLMLSQVGLDENSANDYAEFIDAIIKPLAKAGVATVVLDNTGHDSTRARGSKSKEDLNEVVYEMSVRGTVDIHSTGTLTMKLTRARFGGLHRRLEMQVGGGAYEMPQPVEASYDDEGNWRPTYLMEKIADLLGVEPGLTFNEINERVTGRREYKRTAIETLIREGFVEVQPGARNAQAHSLVKPYLED